MSGAGFGGVRRDEHPVVFRALIRPGRFDRVIAVPLPDVRGRNQILQHHMKEVVTAAG